MLSTQPAQRSVEDIALERIKRSEPIINDARLSHGARFLTACVDDFPGASIAVYFDAGSRREAQGEFGGLHFFEHLPPGAFRIAHDGLNIDQFAQTRCWSININISPDRLSFAFYCPTFDATEAMHVLGELMCYGPDTYKKVFETEKGRILNEIDQNSMNSNRLCEQFNAQLLMDSTGYAHPTIGYRDEVQGYTFEKIMGLGNKFLSPANATIAISGSADIISEGYTYFDKLVLPWSGSPPDPVSILSRPQWADLPLLSKHENRLIGGVELEALFPGPTTYNVREELALRVITWHLSLALGSCLSHSTGLTYGAGMSSRAYGDATYFGGGCNVELGKLERAFELLIATIKEFPDSISRNMIDEAYLSDRNRTFLASHSLNYSPALDYMMVYPDRTYVPHTERLAVLASLSVDELMSLAKSYLDVSKAKFVLHGPAENLAKAHLPF